MRHLRVLALTLVLPALLVDSGGSAPAPADLVWAELQQVSWRAVFADWQQRRPGVRCEAFRMPIESTRAEDEWCYRCTQQTGATVLEWAFYAFGDIARPACRLQQFRARVSAPDEGIQATHRALRARLAARYGSGSVPGAVPYERGAGYWIDTLRWRTEALDLYLYRDTGTIVPSHAGVLARDRALVDAMAQDDARFYGDWDWLTAVPRRWDERLSRALRDQFPELVEVFAYLQTLEREGGDWPRDLDRVRAVLRRLLTAVGTAPSERRAAMLLAAERLGHFWNMVPAYPGWEADRAELGGMGLRFTFSQLGDVWVSSHDLLWRVWQEHPATPWGEDALVLLLHYGWDTGAGCGKGTDRFREVIHEGEAFLAKQPRSPRRADVAFVLGQAYETWWSLSKAEDNPYMDPVDYRSGADRAREQAVRHYEDVLRRAPGSPEAAFARRQLPRLKLGVATVQFRFFCIYD